MANDACTAVLLVFQNIPVLSSFCLFRLDSFNSKKTGFCLSYMDEHLLDVVLAEQALWYYLKMFSCTGHTKEFEEHPE